MVGASVTAAAGISRNARCQHCRGQLGGVPEGQDRGRPRRCAEIDDDMDSRRSTFSDTSSIVHAVEHLLKIARGRKAANQHQYQPRTNGGSHDGAGPVSRWLDAYLTDPGRSICVAAGNAGQERLGGRWYRLGHGPHPHQRTHPGAGLEAESNGPSSATE